MAKLLIKVYNNRHNFYGYVAKEQNDEEYVLYTEDPEQAKQYENYKEAVADAFEPKSYDKIPTKYCLEKEFKENKSNYEFAE